DLTVAEPGARGAPSELRRDRGLRSSLDSPLGGTGIRPLGPRGIDLSYAEGSPSSALVCVDGAASVAERALDLLAPAALSTVVAKTTEHMIEDIVAMSGFVQVFGRRQITRL